MNFVSNWIQNWTLFAELPPTPLRAGAVMFVFGAAASSHTAFAVGSRLNGVERLILGLDWTEGVNPRQEGMHVTRLDPDSSLSREFAHQAFAAKQEILDRFCRT
ncbi:MAG: hypothetical protein JWM11_1752 [Planctomycetaceae bacterium]|nr:hypothetical protein [Planctomycetaceae bacterium]